MCRPAIEGQLQAEDGIRTMDMSSEDKIDAILKEQGLHCEAQALYLLVVAHIGAA